MLYAEMDTFHNSNLRSGGEQKRVAVYTLALSDLRIGKKVSTNIVLR